VKPGSLVKLQLPLLSTSFQGSNEDETDIVWDGTSEVESGDVMVYLGEEINRVRVMARVFHPRFNRVGYVNLLQLCEVRK
jgi:hypothetical protein